MNTVILKEGREKSVLRHHPWIFSGAIREVAGNPGAGETVEVRSARGEFLAHGAYAASSHIPVKLWNFTESAETIRKSGIFWNVNAGIRRNRDPLIRP